MVRSLIDIGEYEGVAWFRGRQFAIEPGLLKAIQGRQSFFPDTKVSEVTQAMSVNMCNVQAVANFIPLREVSLSVDNHVLGEESEEFHSITDIANIIAYEGKAPRRGIPSRVAEAATNNITAIIATKNNPEELRYAQWDLEDTNPDEGTPGSLAEIVALGGRIAKDLSCSYSKAHMLQMTYGQGRDL